LIVPRICRQSSIPASRTCASPRRSWSLMVGVPSSVVVLGPTVGTITDGTRPDAGPHPAGADAAPAELPSPARVGVAGVDDAMVRILRDRVQQPLAPAVAEGQVLRTLGRALAALQVPVPGGVTLLVLELQHVAGGVRATAHAEEPASLARRDAALHAGADPVPVDPGQSVEAVGGGNARLVGGDV